MSTQNTLLRSTSSKGDWHLRRWSWLLIYTWFVIVWGALVRASGSGDGCGRHWPSCHGEFFPSTSSWPTLIEYFHRATSGLYGILILGFVIVLFRSEFSQRARNLSLLVLFFTTTEALIGARLVLFGLVADNPSTERAWSMVMHLVNTLALTGALVRLISQLSLEMGKDHFMNWSWTKKINYKPGFIYWITFIGFLLLGVTGALTALGDTLYPSKSLAEGIAKDFSSDSSWLIQIRVFHPIIALLTVWGIGVVALKQIKVYAHKSLFIVGLLGILIGFLNLFLLAPLWMQLVHLFWANLLWFLFLWIPK